MPPSPPFADLMSFGDFEADLRSRELRRSGIKVRLPDQSFQVLVMLMERPGDLVTREEIQKRLWPSHTFVDFDHGLNNAVNRLRESLGDSAETPKFIETLPRRGYRFICPLNTSSTGSSQSLLVQSVDSTHEPDSAAAAKVIGYRWRILIAAMALIGLGVAGYEVRERLLSRHSSHPIQALAVLPFENLSGDPSQDYFADGITDALITDMAQVKTIRVISRTSAMHFKGSHQPLPEIARELKVDAILEGSVARSGDRVRITAQLIEAASDQHLWAQTYERNFSDILQLQNDLAQAVAVAVTGTLSQEEQTRFSRVRTIDPEAYEEYLKGRFFWNLRTEDGLKKSEHYFESAIKKYPKYAQAYAGLADFHNMSAFSELGWVEPSVAGPKAIAAAEKALQLDPDIAEAHAALGLTEARYGSDFGNAENEFRRAIDLNPAYPNTYIWYAYILDATGRKEQACANNRTAHQLDPLNPTYLRNVAGCLYEEGRIDQAITEASAAVELAPTREDTRYSLASFYEKQGRYREAIEQYRDLTKISKQGDCERSALSYALAKSGQTREAESILNDIKAHPAYPDFDYCLADAYMGLGRNDDAIHSLQEVLRKQGPGGLGLMTSEYRFIPIRADPRFQQLIREAKLSPPSTR